MEKEMKAKQENVLKSEKYEAPMIEIVEVPVERGFAMSSNIAPDDPYSDAPSW